MATNHSTSGQDRNASPVRNTVEDEILRAVRDVRFGSVEVIIHNAQVVQVERREKLRFAEDASPAARSPRDFGRPTTPVAAKPTTPSAITSGPAGQPDAADSRNNHE